jgi:D-alanine-D-alanine ligase
MDGAGLACPITDREGYAMDPGRCPKLLVLGSGPDDGERVAGLVEALSSCGLACTGAIESRPSKIAVILQEASPDLAFCTAFRAVDDSGKAIHLQDLCSRVGVSWIGSSSETLELALSKSRMKERWRAEGVATPDWFTVPRLADGSLGDVQRIEEARAFPYIVKPDAEGNSRGIDADSVVRTPLELYARTRSVVEAYGGALVESFLGNAGAREFTAAMIGNGEKALVGATEIVKHEGGEWVVTNDAKDGHRTMVEPIADRKLRGKVERFAHRAFMAAAVRDYARCDIILEGGRLSAIELNGQPMVPDRWFEACAAGAGLDARQYLRAIVLAGMARVSREGQSFLRIPPRLAASLPEAVVKRLV